MGKQGMNRADGLRVRLVQMEVLPGRPAENTTTILHHIRAAIAEHVDLIAFPEMAIPGYLIADEWERDAFVRECESCTHEVRDASRGIVSVFGSVGVDHSRRNEDGRVRKYNALFVAEDGTFKGPERGPYPFVIKTLLPNYREFDDSRHFFDLRKLALEEQRTVADLVTPVKTSRFSLGGVLCEDGWDMDYNVSPLSLLSTHKPDLCINISASPYTLNKNSKRNRVFSDQAGRIGAPLLYVNNTGIQNNGKTVFTFDGASCIYDAHGHVTTHSTPFEAGELTLDIHDPKAAFGDPVALADDTLADVYQALRYGTRKFMELCHVQRVVVGVSGGIDSAVVAAMYADILPPENLLLVNMPSRYNSATTISLAQELADNLGCFSLNVPIEDSVQLTQSQISGAVATRKDGTDMPLNLTEFMLENVQARDRSSRILAALASAFGGVFTCNANKSETTVGYTTLYGDLGGYLANIADLWKSEVFALAEHCNTSVFGREVIPHGIIALPPSAELNANQNVDEGKGDPLHYPYHDRLFRSWVESWHRTTPEEILEWYLGNELEDKIGYSGKLDEIFPAVDDFISDLERWWNHYQGMGIAKRIQAPPVLAVKRRAFGFDHRESQLGPRYTRRYQELKRSALPSR
jgi:NAD+ synthase (glutamine-hydrolysing)